MNLDLNGYRLHLVFSPTDMRSGYRTLSAIASSCLQLWTLPKGRTAWCLYRPDEHSAKPFGLMQPELRC